MELFHQAGSHGIVEDVISFLLDVFFIVQAVFEEVLLPGNVIFAGERAFPETYGGRYFPIGRKANEQMNVIGHEHAQMTEPGLFFVIETDGMKDVLARVWMAEVVLVARFGAERNEIVGVGADPERRLVVEMAAGRGGHAVILRREADRFNMS